MLMLVVIFIVITALFVFLCKRQLKNIKCHGFYRFFSFELLLLLALINIDVRQLNLFGWSGILSGVCLLSSLAVVVYSLQQLKKVDIKKRDNAPENFTFENTQDLVTQSIYRHVRHPMYSSLLLLGLGLFFQKPSVVGLMILLFVFLFVWLTAWVEEKENIIFFGDQYREYKKSNKMLIPFFL